MTKTPSLQDRIALRNAAKDATPAPVNPVVEYINDQVTQEMVERYNVHHAETLAANFRVQARVRAYDQPPLSQALEQITEKLASPEKLRMWRRISMFGGENGQPGLENSTEYQAFLREAHGIVNKLDPQFDSFRDNIKDALNPDYMTGFLRDHISSTEPEPRQTLHKLIAQHVSEADLAAKRDIELAEQYKSKREFRNESFIRPGM